MSDKYYSRVLMHGSKYGGFITKNGRKNNSSQYNHNYYLANIFKWKKKNKDGDEEESEESEERKKMRRLSEGSYINKKWRDMLRNPENSVQSWSYRKLAQQAYDYAANKYARAKTKSEKTKAKVVLTQKKKDLREADAGYRKTHMNEKKSSYQDFKDKQTKKMREKHLSKGYVDMTSNRKQTAEAHYRGDKILEKNSNNLFSKTRQVKDSSGRTTTYKDVGKLERAGRDTKKKVDRLIAKYSSKKNKKKKKKSRIKVSHNTSLGIGK